MITVLEYAELQSYDQTAIASERSAFVSQETLDWIAQQHQAWRLDDIDTAALFLDYKKNSFKLGAYVGYLQSPFNDEQIQIFPKIEIGLGDIEQSKAILQKMIAVVYDIRAKTVNDADLDHQDIPLHEWIISKFLNALEQLIHEGLKRDYELVQDEQPFIKGRLLVHAHMRRGPGKEATFDVEYDEFLLNGIENCLIKTALDSILMLTQNPNSILMAYEFSALLQDIPVVEHPIDELYKWREDRLLAGYNDIKPWCEIILSNIRPSFQHGLYRGVSLLFSMPHLFEKYVAKKIQLDVGQKLYIEPKSKALTIHRPASLNGGMDQPWFKLKPDLLITENGAEVKVLDTKWKLIHQDKYTSKDKYLLSQSDFYQMFAYGHKYLAGDGQLVLIYPYHRDFTKPLPKFYFSERLVLEVIPFDLENDCCVMSA